MSAVANGYPDGDDYDLMKDCNTFERTELCQDRGRFKAFNVLSLQAGKQAGGRRRARQSERGGSTAAAGIAPLPL